MKAMCPAWQTQRSLRERESEKAPFSMAEAQETRSTVEVQTTDLLGLRTSRMKGDY